MSVLMECGHAANGTEKTSGLPACVVCGSTVVATDQPDLSDRIAKCGYCGVRGPSSRTLAFFEYKPDREFDAFYCGCFGWD